MAVNNCSICAILILAWTWKYLIYKFTICYLSYNFAYNFLIICDAWTMGELVCVCFEGREWRGGRGGMQVSMKHVLLATLQTWYQKLWVFDGQATVRISCYERHLWVLQIRSPLGQLSHAEIPIEPHHDGRDLRGKDNERTVSNREKNVLLPGSTILAAPWGWRPSWSVATNETVRSLM